MSTISAHHLLAGVLYFLAVGIFVATILYAFTYEPPRWP